MEKMRKLLILLYGIPNRFLRNVIKHIVLKLDGGGQFFSPTIRDIYVKYHGLDIGYGTYGGCFVYENFPSSKVSFGRYCSIGSNLKVFRANHPSENFTLHPYLYNPALGYVEKDLLERSPLMIGNDVWIGSGVIICPGCKQIGDGCVIGAGSVVTHDVEPYTIIAGNPAKVIRKRFNEKQIAFLEQSQWWLLDYDALKQQTEYYKQELHRLGEA